MAWTLCSKADVKSIHPISEAELKDFWSDVVEEMISQHIGISKFGELGMVVDERYSGDGTTLLIPRQVPIVSVQSLKVNDLALVSSDYVVSPGFVGLINQVFPEGRFNIKISYSFGQAEITPLVRMTAANMIVAIAIFKGRQGADASLKWADPDKQKGEPTPTFNLGLTKHLNTIMKSMLRREKLRVG